MIRRCEQLCDWFRHMPVWLLLAGILLLSFLLKLLCHYLEPVVSRDGSLYIRLAQIWHDTGNFQGVLDAWNAFWLPPLPFYLMKCLMCLGFSAEAAGVWLNLILGAVTPLFAYGIAYEVIRRKDTAICSALLVAVNPSMNSLSVEVQRDMVYLSLAGAVLWLISAGIRRQKAGYWLGAGLICGCAMLTRFETLEFLAVIPLILLCLLLGKYSTWKKLLCYGILFFASFFGSVFTLSFVMKTQDYLLPIYERYYQRKITCVKKLLQAEGKEPEK